MKKLLTLAAAALLALGASQAWALRIATIDVKKAFDAYNGTQTAKDKLKAQVDSREGQAGKASATSHQEGAGRTCSPRSR